MFLLGLQTHFLYGSPGPQTVLDPFTQTIELSEQGLERTCQTKNKKRDMCTCTAHDMFSALHFRSKSRTPAINMSKK